MCLVLEVADDLIGGKDGADFDFTVDLLELKALPRLQVHGLTDFFWDYDLVFG